MTERYEETPAHSEKIKPLTIAEMLIYAFPSFPGAMGAAFYNVNVFYYFSNTLGVSLNALNLAYSIDMIFVVMFFPICGWLLDNTRTKYGRRKPWLLLSSPLLFLSVILFWFPPFQGEWVALWYGIWNCLIIISTFLVSTPYASLAVEITPDYIDRSKLFGFIQAFSMLGWLVGVGIPPVILGQLHDKGEHVTKIVYLGFTLTTCIIGVFSFGTMLWMVKEPKPSQIEDEAEKKNDSIPIGSGVRFSLFYNRPFQLVLIAITLINATPYFMSLLPYWAQSTLDVNPTWQGALLVLVILLGFLCLPAWYFLTKKTNKIVAFQLMLFIGGIAFILYIFPGIIIGGKDTIVTKILAIGVCVLYGATGLSMTYNSFLYMSIQGDTIDYDELLTGLRRESQYTNLMQLFNWLVSVFNITLPFDIISALGYVATNSSAGGVPVTDLDENIRVGVAILIGPVAGIMVLACMIAMYYYPITKEVYDDIKEKLELSKNGETVFDPISQKWIPPPFQASPSSLVPLLDDPEKENIQKTDAASSTLGPTNPDFELRWNFFHFSEWELKLCLNLGLNFLIWLNLFLGVLSLIACVLVGAFWVIYPPFGDYAPYVLIVFVIFLLYFASAVNTARKLILQGVNNDDIVRHLNTFSDHPPR